jgi:hypothetical protein
MQKQAIEIPHNKCRKNERGAALVTVLMISFLLLVAVGALLLETSMNTANVTDATAEEQAYYAAESGIQTTLNVLRGNTFPNPLIDPSKDKTDPANKIDYFKAIRLCTSNICDCSNPPSSSCGTDARLSRWLTYDTTDTDRVTLLGSVPSGTPLPYSRKTGYAYKIRLENPDNTNNKIIYTTSGNINKAGVGVAYSPPSSGLTISYKPYVADAASASGLDVSTGINNTDFGKFTITGTGTISERVRFTINVSMTKPYVGVRTIRGFIEAGSIPATGSQKPVKIFYDSKAYVLSGSTITLLNGVDIADTSPLADGTYRVGYEVTPTTLPDTKVSGTMTATEPRRLIIHSTGFGPQGAQKQLDAVIQKSYFDGLSAPSPLTLIGPESSPSSTFLFDPGSSAAIRYSGKDVLLTAFLPPIGLTNESNVETVNQAIQRGFNGKVFGTVSNVTDELPFWLQSPANLDKALSELKDVAKASGRYYPVGTARPANGDYGNNAKATGITFIEGDLDFSQDGGGILVVTGRLEFQGAFNFNGLVIVTGAGGMNRTGGGNGVLQGNMVVAPYNSAGVSSTSCPLQDVTCFLAPRYRISGGGNSEIVYNSNNVANGLTALNNFVKGVAEK